MNPDPKWTTPTERKPGYYMRWIGFPIGAAAGWLVGSTLRDVWVTCEGISGINSLFVLVVGPAVALSVGVAYWLAVVALGPRSMPVAVALGSIVALCVSLAAISMFALSDVTCLPSALPSWWPDWLPLLRS